MSGPSYVTQHSVCSHMFSYPHWLTILRTLLNSLNSLTLISFSCSLASVPLLLSQIEQINLNYRYTHSFSASKDGKGKGWGMEGRRGKKQERKIVNLIPKLKFEIMFLGHQVWRSWKKKTSSDNKWALLAVADAIAWACFEVSCVT